MEVDRGPDEMVERSGERPSRKTAGQQKVLVNGGEPNINGSVTGMDTLDADDGEDENIFLFIPNMIGYFRIILATASLYYMPLHPRTCCLLYSISCLLDALDGYTARIYDQATTFGAVLDMVTDRCTTSCLLVFLASAWPRWSILFQGLISLDLASHYIHMYATLTMGAKGQSHKKVDSGRSRILHLYYTNRTVLFIFCAVNELFFISLYLLSFSSPLLSPSLLSTTTTSPNSPFSSAPDNDIHDATTPTLLQPGSPAHPAPSTLFLNPWSAGALEAARANKMDSTVPWILVGISAPICFGKQLINVIQLVKASRWLAEGDVENRRRERRSSSNSRRGKRRRKEEEGEGEKRIEVDAEMIDGAVMMGGGGERKKTR